MFSRYNIHTHTSLCHHATGEVSDYCEAALRSGLCGLGFSDHCPFPDGRWGRDRMALEDLSGYVTSVREAGLRLQSQLPVLLGIECEYVPSWSGFFRDELLGHCGMDYLLAASHYHYYDDGWMCLFAKVPMDDRELCAYTDYVVSALCSGFYVVMAHPDLFGCRYRGWNATASSCCRTICQAAVSQGVYLEINAKGFRRPPVEDHGVLRAPYPVRGFWELAREEGVSCFLGSDAHQPSDVWGGMDPCVSFASSCGLEPKNDDVWGVLSHGGGRKLGGVQ